MTAANIITTDKELGRIEQWMLANKPHSWATATDQLIPLPTDFERLKSIKITVFIELTKLPVYNHVSDVIIRQMCEVIVSTAVIAWLTLQYKTFTRL